MSDALLNILHVEDSSAEAHLLRSWLDSVQHFECSLTTVPTIAGAIDAAGRDVFDAVLLDLNLPDSDGVESISQIVELVPGTPVVVLSGVQDLELERTAICAGVQDFVVKGSLAPDALVRVLRHAVERSRLQAAIERQNRRLATLTSNFRHLVVGNVDAMLVLDHSGHVRFANPAAEKLFGCRPEGLVGSPIGIVPEPGKRTDLEIVSADGVTLTAEARISETIWMETSAFLVTLRDISDRKQEEDSLRAAVRVAEEASRAKSAFLANMSHELRTPLNSILGFAEMIDCEVFGPLGHDKYSEYLEVISGSGRHLLGLINDLLDLSKAEAGKLFLEDSEFDLDSLVGACLAIISPEAERGGMITRYDPTGIRLHADERKIKQVLLNLLSNAVKFSHPSGHIWISATVGITGELTVSVADDGIGMSDEALAVAFDAYVQADQGYARKREGTGLGLALSKAFVDLHGGSISIASTLGVGTSISFTLPSRHVLSCGGPVFPAEPMTAGYAARLRAGAM